MNPHYRTKQKGEENKMKKYYLTIHTQYNNVYDVEISRKEFDRLVDNSEVGEFMIDSETDKGRICIQVANEKAITRIFLDLMVEEDSIIS